jgi:formylglycine-generating enzyme
MKNTAIENMVFVPGGRFLMGSDNNYPGENTVRFVTVAGFYIDKYEVTNGDYAKFVYDTGYNTVAERPLNPEDHPGINPKLLKPGSLVFWKTRGPVDLMNYYNWWSWVRGASWKQPYGPGSNIKGREKHPAIHIAFEDAVAYAYWAGKELPTVAEWEYASRGGLEGMDFTWANDDIDIFRPMADTWPGIFPFQNLSIDKCEGTSPVGSFAPNGYGLYDMAGNMWEWTCDWFYSNAHAPRPTIKGGSYLCAPNLYLCYRPAWQPQIIDTGMSHLGFRCVYRDQSFLTDPKKLL